MEKCPRKPLKKLTEKFKEGVLNNKKNSAGTWRGHCGEFLVETLGICTNKFFRHSKKNSYLRRIWRIFLDELLDTFLEEFLLGHWKHL